MAGTAAGIIGTGLGGALPLPKISRRWLSAILSMSAGLLLQWSADLLPRSFEAGRLCTGLQAAAGVIAIALQELLQEKQEGKGGPLNYCAQAS